jgi:hypothetical protein
VICVAAALGAVAAGVVFPRRARRAEGDITVPEAVGDTALVPAPIPIED